MANNRELSQFASTVGHNGGSIGIGTDNPLQKLHLLDTTSANIYLQTHNAGTGSTAGVYFRTSDSSTADGFFKTAIVLEDDGTSWARGKLHILQDNTADNSNATLDDSVLTINQSGNIGIGTDNPTHTLQLFGTSSSTFRISKSGVLAYDHTFDGSTYEIKNNNGSAGIPLIIGTKTSGGESLRITSGGSVGIGTDTPGAKLEVFDATSNTILNVKSGDAGAVLNLIDDSARSSIEQNGTTLKISSDTGAEDARVISDCR